MLMLAGLLVVIALAALIRIAGPRHRRRWLGQWLGSVTPSAPRLTSLHRVTGYPDASRRMFPC